MELLAMVVLGRLNLVVLDLEDFVVFDALPPKVVVLFQLAPTADADRRGKVRRVLYLYRGQLRNPLQQRLVRRVLGVEHGLESRAGRSLGQTQPAHVHVEANPYGDGRSRRWRNRCDITTHRRRRSRRRLVMVMTAPSVSVVLSSSNTNTAHSAAADHSE
uniref:(northern house mosquito) hypothetical protein n=1 Tax=Culex pipiens TaxID=7175 RepID=A0A8D8MB12_CULPI